MDIQTLISTVAKDSKPPPLMPDQFEFTIDKAARKVAHRLDFLAKKELVRVQTNRPYQLGTTLDLPDLTSGQLRPIQCSVLIEGNVAKTAEAARLFVEAALRADFDFVALAGRVLEAAVSEFSARLTPPGSFVRSLRTQQGLADMQAHLNSALRDAQLATNRVVLTPLASDLRAFVNLQDDANSLEIRTQDLLQARRVGYKVRLKWGKDEEQVVGRLTYRGKVEGREPGAPLSHPTVSGQLQPLEAWFRVLLANALAHRSWRAICAAEPQVIEEVGREISLALGRGTGRVVETLVIYPSLEQGAAVPEMTGRFTQKYPIAGMKGDGLVVDHAIRFTMTDRGRWEACKSPDPLAFLKQQVVDAARSFLLDMRFEEVIALYLRGAAGEAELRAGIESRVAASATSIGHSLGSVATILTIPQMDYVQGRALEFAERSYQLATAHLSPAITIRARVRVRQTGSGGIVFARALARDEDFDERVRATIEDIVRGQLRGVEALQYYASHYVNGVGAVQDAATGEWGSISGDERQFQRRMREALDDALASKFGLETVAFDLVPGADRLIARMRQLSRLPITHEEDLQFQRGGSQTTVKLHAHATLFVASIDTQHWDSFYLNAMRLSDAEHRALITDSLHEVLKLLEGLVVDEGHAKLKDSGAKALIVQWFTRRMSEELGLVVQLRPLVLRVQRPKVGQVALELVDSLQRELNNLLGMRERVEDQPTGGYSQRGQTREALTLRIQKVRQELKEAASEQESDIANSETVLIEQHPVTGRLLE